MSLDIQMASERPGKRRRLVSYSDSEDSDIGDNSKIYNISQTSRKIATKYGMEEIGYEVSFSQEKIADTRLESAVPEIREMFQEVLDRAGRSYDNDDRVRLSIMHNSLDTPIIVHLAPRNQVTADTVMERLVSYYYILQVLIN